MPETAISPSTQGGGRLGAGAGAAWVEAARAGEVEKETAERVETETAVAVWLDIAVWGKMETPETVPVDGASLVCAGAEEDMTAAIREPMRRRFTAGDYTKCGSGGQWPF